MTLPLATAVSIATIAAQVIVPPVRFASLRPVPATAREMKSKEMTASIEPALVSEAAFRLRLPVWPGAMVPGSARETAEFDELAVRSRLS